MREACSIGSLEYLHDLWFFQAYESVYCVVVLLFGVVWKMEVVPAALRGRYRSLATDTRYLVR